MVFNAPKKKGAVDDKAGDTKVDKANEDVKKTEDTADEKEIESAV